MTNEEKKNITRLRMTRRRVKRLILTRELQQDMFLPLNCWFKIEGLPDDAAIVGMTTAFEYAGCWIFIWSSTFESVPEGEAIPELVGFNLRIREDA